MEPKRRAYELIAWALKRYGGDIEQVVYRLGVPRAVVVRMADIGVPELGLPPIGDGKDVQVSDITLAQAKREARKLFGSERVKTPANVVDTGEVSSALAAVMQEVDEKVRELNETIKRLEKETDKAETNIKRAEQLAIVRKAHETLELAKKRAEEQKAKIEAITAAVVRQDTVKRSAEEAAASRLMLQSTIKLSVAISHYADKLLDAIISNQISIPAELDTKTLAQLSQIILTLNTAIEKSIKIERLRSGEPDTIVGVQIHKILDVLSDQELNQLAETGRLPENPQIVQLLSINDDKDE